MYQLSQDGDEADEKQIRSLQNDPSTILNETAPNKGKGGG
jgi:hypothetical protein